MAGDDRGLLGSDVDDMPDCRRGGAPSYRFVIYAAVGVAFVFGHAAGAADSVNGERLARRLCADCHLIERIQRQGRPDAPPFVDIARIPNVSAERIVRMVLAPHPPMPELPLTTGQAEDLDAYIHSLVR